MQANRKEVGSQGWVEEGPDTDVPEVFFGEVLSGKRNFVRNHVTDGCQHGGPYFETAL